MATCVFVCLSLAAFPHYCTDPDVSWGMVLGKFAIGARVSLRGPKCQLVLVLALCLVVISMTIIITEVPMSNSWHKGTNTPSVRSPGMNEERMLLSSCASSMDHHSWSAMQQHHHLQSAAWTSHQSMDKHRQCETSFAALHGSESTCRHLCWQAPQ